MPLSAGTRIGSFEIVTLIGEGGMGEVYRARDGRLGRDVAIKILPAAFTRDVARLDRFEREARVLASLNHPNIAAIYGVEGGPSDADRQFALVLEFVEGETLADLIHRRSSLPTGEALAIARQIADALDAAHEKGIVHRDLKPANVKVTPDGTVKVLDFGLAKAMGGSDPYGSLDSTIGSTHEGVVLGTAAYMSPEQARAQPVDKRTDIWAFGCVLYEMLTGRPAFHAPTMSDTIARILGGHPDWTALPADTPAGVRQLLERCLERDTKRRLRDVGDVSLALQAPTPEAGSAPRRRLVPALVALAATALLSALGAAAFMRPRTTVAEPAEPVRFTIPLSVRLPPASSFAVSPDGRRIVLAGAMSDSALGLWIRDLDAIDLRPLSGTAGQIRPNTTLFWSPDGRTIGFFADGAIRRVDDTGGAPQDVCRVTGVSVGGTWNRAGVIVVGSTAGGLLRCPADGGEATQLTQVPDGNTFHVFPTFLPDGRHVVYLRISRTDPSINGLYVADVDLPAGDQSGDRLLGTGFGASVVVDNDGSGHILFVRDQALFAVPFDAGRLVVSGEPVQIASSVGTFRDGALFDATANLLVYRGAAPDVRLQWRTRTGSEAGSAGEPGAYVGLALSPEGMRLAVLRETRQTRADQDVWLMDLARDTARPLTTDSQMESAPAWSHDGQAVLFAVGHGDVQIHPLDGSPPRVVMAKDARPEVRVNPLLTTLNTGANGRILVMSTDAAGRAQSDLWMLSLDDGAVAPLVQQDFSQTQGVMSPDGGWLAYVSNESGVNEVVVRPLTTAAGSTMPTAGPATVVSRGGGNAPRWRRDNGSELFYQSPAGGVMAVSISPRQIGRPVELFRVPGLLPYWDVAADGRFLVAVPVTPEVPPLTAVLNWQAELSR